MTNTRKNWAVLATTLLVIGALVVTSIKLNGDGEDNMNRLLRLTARTSFILYLLVFVARPLRQLADTRLTRAMAINRRYLGITFAGAHSVHLVLVLLYVLDPGNLRPTVAIGALTYAFMFTMLITSFDGPAVAIGPVAWRRLHKTGLYWIGAIFSYTLVANLLSEPGNPVFLVLGVLLLAAVGVRITAFLRKQKS